MHEICEKMYKNPPSKNNFLEFVNFIKEKDPDCPNPPGKRSSKTRIYRWLVENINSYYAYLMSL